VLFPAFAILVDAALLARSSGATEIGVDELLVVTAKDFTPIQSADPTADAPFGPVSKYDVQQLRAALLQAQSKDKE